MPDAVLQLLNVAGTPLYLESNPPVASGVLAYFVDSLPANPLPSITPGGAWNDPAYNGWFVFLPATPAQPKALADALAGELPKPAAPGFAWIGWDEAKGIVSKQTVSLGAEGTIAARASFAFGRYGFSLDAGMVVTAMPSAEPDHFSINVPTGPGWPRRTKRSMEIPLYGAQRFCVVDEGLIRDFSDDMRTGSDAAIRYYSGPKTSLTEYRFALFDPATTSHRRVTMQWDPLGAKPPARTLFVLQPASYTVAKPALRAVEGGDLIATTLRTIYDDPILLFPTPTASLVLDVTPSGYALFPAGDFELATTPPASQATLLCGLSGTELIFFQPRSPDAPGDLITFTPYQPAWAPVTDGTAPGALLDGDFTTSWVSVAAFDANRPATTYSAQPPASPLFQPGGTTSVLDLFSPGATMPGIPFPLAPYAGVAAADAGAYAILERNVLAPARKKIMSTGTTTGGRRSVSSPAAAPVVATTPQGFLATIQGLTWQQVLIALGSAGEQLMFSSLTPELTDVLQSQDLFLVVSTGKQLGTFSNAITIAGWPFTIATGTPDASGDPANILIFKFCKGSLQERAATTATWSGGDDDFHPGRAALSSWLNDYFSTAQQLLQSDPHFDYFVNTVVNSPAWQGVLALNTEIAIGNFPSDIKGLLGGIDLTRFRAHHFGVTTSSVDATQGLQMQHSSLFGLIRYVATNDPAPPSSPPPPPQPFDFRVLTLEVLFANSKITSFHSEAVLILRKLFGDAVQRQTSNASNAHSILLKGRYENHGGVAVYTFTSDDDLRFLAANSAALNYAEFVKAVFHTFHQGQDGATATHVVSEFSLWGYLNFKALPGVDILSFGDETSDLSPSALGLYCANLGIRMSFDIDEQINTIANRAFLFDVSGVTFDLTRSTARTAALFKRFPITVDGFDSGDADRTPPAAGYLPVRAILLDTLPLSTEWYALLYGLNLGSLGGLAGDAGFSATLVAAWSPGQAPTAALLIELPLASPGKLELSLQGVLRLGIGSIDFITQSNDATRYMIRLRDIGLYFLGKKLPRYGTAGLLLFGDPSQQATPGGNLAWYAAYTAGS